MRAITFKMMLLIQFSKILKINFKNKFKILNNRIRKLTNMTIKVLEKINQSLNNIKMHRTMSNFNKFNNIKMMFMHC